jgi:predicted helicase
VSLQQALNSRPRTELTPADLAGIPPETFDYRLGSRSALDWIIDQYQVKGESDPNREDDPGYIVRLIGQVVRVSIETQEIVKTLPAFRP